MKRLGMGGGMASGRRWTATMVLAGTLAGCFHDDDDDQPSAPSGAFVWTAQYDATSDEDKADACLVVGEWVFVLERDSASGNPAWRIEKRSMATGALDANFGSGGVIPSNPSTGEDFALAAATDGTWLFVVGHDSVGGDLRWRIEKRSLATGAPDSAFTDGASGGGVVAIDPSTNNDSAVAVAYASGALYVAGHEQPSGYQRWLIKKIDPANGSVSASVFSQPSTNDAEPQGIVADGSAIYVVGSDRVPGNKQWRIEKRRLADLELFDGDPGPVFGTGGVVTEDVSGADDVANAVAIDGSALYVLGEDRTGGTSRWRLEKRDLLSGNSTWTVVNDPAVGTDDDQPNWVAVDGGSLYLFGIGLVNLPTAAQGRIEKRRTSDGELDTGFGTQGVVTTDASYIRGWSAGGVGTSNLVAAGLDMTGGNSKALMEGRRK